MMNFVLNYRHFSIRNTAVTYSNLAFCNNNCHSFSIKWRRSHLRRRASPPALQVLVAAAPENSNISNISSTISNIFSTQSQHFQYKIRRFQYKSTFAPRLPVRGWRCPSPVRSANYARKTRENGIKPSKTASKCHENVEMIVEMASPRIETQIVNDHYLVFLNLVGTSIHHLYQRRQLNVLG